MIKYGKVLLVNKLSSEIDNVSFLLRLTFIPILVISNLRVKIPILGLMSLEIYLAVVKIFLKNKKYELSPLRVPIPM